MSKYTTELRTLLTNNFDIGLKEYPIFDESYRTALNQKITNHYYFREIGLETAELFKFYLNRKMNEIMPYYNQLYKSQLLTFNPLYNVDTTETLNAEKHDNNQFNGTVDNDGTNVTDISNNIVAVSHSDVAGHTDNKNVSSDTPQGKASIISIDDDTWATKADLSKSNSTGSNDNNSTDTTTGKNTLTLDTKQTSVSTAVATNTEEYTRKVLGKSAGESYSKLLDEFRATFLNIDMQVIEELKSCFMLIY